MVRHYRMQPQRTTPRFGFAALCRIFEGRSPFVGPRNGAFSRSGADKRPHVLPRIGLGARPIAPPGRHTITALARVAWPRYAGGGPHPCRHQHYQRQGSRLGRDGLGLPSRQRLRGFHLPPQSLQAPRTTPEGGAARNRPHLRLAPLPNAQLPHARCRRQKSA